MSGNSYYDNVEVKDFTISNKLTVRDFLDVKSNAKFDDLNVKNTLSNRIFNITNNNEIILDDDATIKLANSPISYKTRDIFEIIAFLKYMIKVCGSKMEKCDFNQLLKTDNFNQREQMIHLLKDKFTKLSEDFFTEKNNTQNTINPTKNFNDNKKKLLRQEPIKLDKTISTINHDKDNTFKFKETLTNNEFSVSKDIEDIINTEYKMYKENDYENFLNSPMLQDFAENFYHDILN